MRRKKYVLMLTLTFLLGAIISSVMIDTLATVSSISATINFDPDKINLRDPIGDSPYVMAFIRFPNPLRREVININASTVLLEGTIPVTHYDAAKTVFKAFFDRVAFEEYLWFKVYHMGYVEPFKRVEVKLRITGKLYNGTPFEGSDIISVSAK